MIDDNDGLDLISKKFTCSIIPDDTDFSESEGLSSAQTNKRDSNLRSPTSATSETEEESRDEPRVLRIETKQAPKPSQPEVVLSDGKPNLISPCHCHR